ncbi:hypothetical protein CLV62_14625 [Dysgonomonas alginatilytica]|uniref:Uncharacterized protein n=2 Tax=Dysgonomonas alginatilytica TaxID=1605892 RepID=A0A2V3PHU7_9BACT|nr:hypothetical protein CLV62_14625 [Dysgonomonas alginatilytica]
MPNETQIVSDKAESEQDVQVEPFNDKLIDHKPMSGWKAYGLIGKVKTVKENNGYQLEFNTDGNVIKIVKKYSDSESIFIRKYDSPSMYTEILREGSTAYEIILKDNIRKEKIVDDYPDEEKYFSYTFDKQGRVIEFNDRLTYWNHNSNSYIYEKDSDVLPQKEIFDEGWEDGSCTIISTFEYLKVDNMGNWTERKVNKKVTEYESMGEKKTQKTDSQIETRIITYFSVQ